MDFGGAMADAPDPHLAEKTLNRQLAGVAETTENLDAAVGDALRHLGRVEFGDKRLVADLLLGVGHPPSAIDQQPRSFQLDLGIGEHPLNSLTAGDRFA